MIKNIPKHHSYLYHKTTGLWFYMMWRKTVLTGFIDLKTSKTDSETSKYLEIIEIKIINEMAWVAYHNDATFSIENKIIRKAHWLESATAILTENG